MRNLKRALSLTLASVMLLGMMVMGSGAASYPDVSEEDNIEAIEVLQAVQVMRGDDNGNFDPDRNVTRAEMAVVMALLLDYDYQYYETSCPFADVPEWARSYVGACYINKIVAGYNGTTYGANDGVTAVQASAMMMRALGYFQTDTDYADGFETATVRQGTRIGIYNGVGSRANVALTRNQVAQMALNALQCTMVDARKNSADITVGSGDTAVTITGNVEYVVRTSSEDFAKAINGTENSGGVNGVTGVTIELGEQLYNGDLKKTTSTDAFGAPATVWNYKNTEIGRYANEADAVYTTEVAIKDIYKDLGVSGELAHTNVKFMIDGEGESGLTANDGSTALSGVKLTDADPDGSLKIGGKGSLVKAYYNADAPTDKAVITVINYYLAKAEDDYNAGDGEVDLAVYGDNGDYGTLTVKNSDVAVSGVGKDDYLVVTIADEKIKTAVPVEVVSDVQVSVARNKDYVTAGGQKYEYNDVAKKSSNALGSSYIADKDEYSLNDSTYNLYLDPCGYVLGVEAVEENASVGSYLVITQAAADDAYDVVVKVMFADGTKKTIPVSKVDGADATKGALTTVGKFYTFREKSGGDYELTAVQTSAGGGKAYSPTNTGTGVNGGIDSKAQPISGVASAGTNSTVFIADGKVYTGVRNAPKVDTTSSNIFYVLDKNDRLLLVWTPEKGKTQTSSDDLVYILNNSPAVTKDGDDIYYLYKAIYQGKTVDDFASNDLVEDRGLYAIDSYTDDRADLSRDRLVSKLASTDDTYEYGKEITGITSKDDVLTVTGTDAAGNYLLAEDCKIYTIDDTTVKQPSADSLSTERTIDRDGFDTITLVRAEDDTDAEVIAVYLSKASESPNEEVEPGDTVTDPSADDMEEALKGDTDATLKGEIPSGTFGGETTPETLPNVTFEDANISGETVINGEVTVDGTVTIPEGGSLETLEVTIKNGATLDQTGDLKILVLNFEQGAKWKVGESTFVAAQAFTFDSASYTVSGRDIQKLTIGNDGSMTWSDGKHGNDCAWHGLAEMMFFAFKEGLLTAG